MAITSATTEPQPAARAAEPLAARLAASAVAHPADAIPPAVLQSAGDHLLDVIGCALAAHGLGVGGAGRSVVTTDAAQGPSTAIGVAHGLPARDAALANGVLCHALDFDDTHARSVCHITTVVAPAALATAEAVDASGAQLLAALVVGTEVAARIGSLAPAGFHARGWHPTAMCGVFGAAAACARLRGLDPATATSALGIAGSMAGGLMAYLDEGTRTKPLHAGWAAHAGVVACELAAAGGEGPAGVLESRLGLLRAALGDREGEAAAAAGADLRLGEDWELLQIGPKAYPACHFIHGALRALEELEPDADEVAAVTARVPPAAVPIVCEPADAKRAPRTPYEAQFSLQWCLAALLHDGRLDLRSYEPARLADPAVARLAGRIAYEAAPFASFPGAFPGAVDVRLRDGRALGRTVPYEPGHPRNPLARADLERKFAANAALAGADAGALAAALRALPHASSAREILRALP